MNRLELSTPDGTWFRPGSELIGTASWTLVEEAAALEVRLLWHTAGKGTRDVAVVDQHRYERPDPRGSVEFRFRLPEGPVAFTGRLITLAWAIELVVLPSEDSTRLDIQVGPQPVELDISTLREL